MTGRDSPLFRLYDVCNRAETVEAGGRARVDGEIAYIGRRWGFYRLLIRTLPADAAPKRFHLYLGLIERAGPASDAPLRVRAAASETRTEPSQRGVGLLELDRWPHAEWQLPLPLVAIGRENALQWNRITEFWAICDFIYLHEPSLAPIRAAEAPPDPLPVSSADSYRCGQCGAWHDGRPLAYTLRFPDAWFEVPREEWASRVWLDGEGCHLDGRRFLRARLRLPIIEGPHPFDVRVWVEVNAAVYMQLAARWNAQNRENDPPRPGWVANELTGYRASRGLRCAVYFDEDGIISCRLQDAAHQLAADQRAGISRECTAVLLPNNWRSGYRRGSDAFLRADLQRLDDVRHALVEPDLHG